MAVTFVIGNANRLPQSLFDPSTTIASIVAMEFPESLMGSLKQSSLLALGFLLFVIPSSCSRCRATCCGRG
jgi:phosphate transport system permease protein